VLASPFDWQHQTRSGIDGQRDRPRIYRGEDVFSDRGRGERRTLRRWTRPGRARLFSRMRFYAFTFRDERVINRVVLIFDL
jgi:hypothetical protein